MTKNAPIFFSDDIDLELHVHSLSLNSFLTMYHQPNYRIFNFTEASLKDFRNRDLSFTIGMSECHVLVISNWDTQI